MHEREEEAVGLEAGAEGVVEVVETQEMQLVEVAAASGAKVTSNPATIIL